MRSGFFCITAPSPDGKTHETSISDLRHIAPRNPKLLRDFALRFFFNQCRGGRR